MIHYFFILMSVVCFAAQFAFTKVFQGKVGQSSTASLVMLTGTALVGALGFFFLSGFQVNCSVVSLLYALVLALIMLPYYMIGIKVISLGSLALYSMFMMLGGMLVPFFYGVLFLNESLSVGKLVGTLLLTLFIVLQAVGQEEPHESGSKRKSKKLFFILCLAIFFINGLTGVVAKAHSISEGAVDEISFTVIYCSLTCLISLAVLLAGCLRKTEQKLAVLRKARKGGAMGVTALLGAVAYGGSYLQLLAAGKVPASVQFPLVSGGVIVLSALVSAFLFREKLSKKEWISVAGAFVSTFLFAF